ncbi:glycosyltransferase, partial [Candidatus Pelagibacter sp.]|nr:glycosyltransferase [Candidatus Pelagibacter sp.]
MGTKNIPLLNNKSQQFDVFLPVIDETFSLQKTIEVIEKDNSKFISNYLIVLSKQKSKSKSKSIAKKLKQKYKNKVKIIYQQKKFIGGAIKSAIKNIKSSHFILMASDLETNP